MLGCVSDVNPRLQQFVGFRLQQLDETPEVSALAVLHVDDDVLIVASRDDTSASNACFLRFPF
jgi:hypothetical protein